MAKKAKSASGAGAETRGVDLEQVKHLLAFMEENGLEEFEYEKRGVHIRLKKASVAAATPVPVAEVAHAGAHHAAPVAPAPPASREPAKEAREEALHVVKSPIVGTFYARPSPEAEPFITVGGRVEVGQVLCIIEAMKLMNEIESDVAGEVVQAFVENGHPVEYGQPLFGIRPRGKK